MRGFLEIGVIAKRQDFIAQAIKMGDAMLGQVQGNGFIAGRFNAKWQPTVKWSCLTGNAQISINWCRLAQITADMRYVDAAAAVMQQQQLAGRQHVRHQVLVNGATVAGGSLAQGARGGLRLGDLAGVVVGMAHRMDSCGGVEDNPSDLPRPEPAW